jgi:predicted nucleotidyltransferase component of viral defense system
MNRTTTYSKQVQLLLQVLPFIFREKCFALKGGTAINLFIRDMPRLSVDIDLVYLGDEDRRMVLEIIAASLARIADSILSSLSGTTIHKAFEEKPDALRLLVTRNMVQIKIELSPVLRGTVFPPELRTVSDIVEEKFGFAEAPIVSMPDLYGGKICAALDRQHPRDLFDVKLLLETEGVTDFIRKATLVYMISHPRPIAELLNPHRKDISSVFSNEFLGMTRDTVTLDELVEARETLIRSIQINMTSEEKDFLLSFKNKNPQWDKLGISGIEKLPAVQWKIHNLNKMNIDKQKIAFGNLERIIATF